MKTLFYLVASIMLLGSLAAAASTAGDTATCRLQTGFFFCKIPPPILQRPTLANYRPRPFTGDEPGAAEYQRRKENLGVTLAFAGGIGMLVGAYVVHATNRASVNLSVSDPQYDAYLYAFFGGIVLVPVSFILSVTGLTIYGIHRRKRRQAESDY